MLREFIPKFRSSHALKARTPNDRKNLPFGDSNIILSLDRKEYIYSCPPF